MITGVDVEFGRLQAKDMLQHLWTGPISNASVEVVQGGRSVEVRAVGVTKVRVFWSSLKYLVAFDFEETRALASYFMSFFRAQRLIEFWEK